MSIDFPGNPTTGDTYSYNYTVYQWDGDKWTSISSTETELLTVNSVSIPPEEDSYATYDHLTYTLTFYLSEGAHYVIGSGVPDINDGTNGDLYLDQLTGDLYQRSLDVWTLYLNIMGPAGPQGEKGDPGDPGGPQGEQGDPGFSPYIDGTTKNWIDSTGDTGVLAEGTQGAQGDPGPAGSVDAGAYMQFVPQNPPMTYSEALLYYDASMDALAYFNNVDSTPIYLGRQTVSKVKNISGATISHGTPVFISGAQGNQVNIEVSDASDPATSKFFGYVRDGIDHNDIGYVVTYGILEDVDLTVITDGPTLLAGDALHVSPTTPGKVTNIAPSLAGTFEVRAGGVIQDTPSTSGTIAIGGQYGPLDWNDTTAILAGDHTVTGHWNWTGGETPQVEGYSVWQEQVVTLGGDHTTTGDWTFSKAATAGITVKDSDVVSDTEDRTFFGQVGTASGISTVGSSGNPHTYWQEFYRIGTSPSSVVIMGDGGGPLGVGTRSLNSLDTLQVNGSISSNLRVVFDNGTARTLSDDDKGAIVRFATNSAVTVTVPDSLPSGFTCLIRNNFSGTLTLTGSGATIDGNASVVVDDPERYTTLIKETAGQFFTAGNVT